MTHDAIRARLAAAPGDARGPWYRYRRDIATLLARVDELEAALRALVASCEQPWVSEREQQISGVLASARAVLAVDE